MLRMFILATILTTGTAVANEPPPVPEGGLIPLANLPCADEETGEEGHCWYSQDLAGNLYVAFFQGEELMFIRQIVGDGYTVVWVNDLYMGV